MKRILSALAGLALASTTWADGAAIPPAITAAVKHVQPTATITAVVPSPVPGLLEVQMKDFDSVYMTPDGQYFIGGDMMHLDAAGKVVDLTEEKQRIERAAWLHKIPEADEIVYKATKPAKATLYVFTDVDCPYCRKFHTNIDDYNAMGIEVRYLAYPRAGIDSDSYAKMENVWCADDRKKALTRVKAGGDVPTVGCKSPVAKQFHLGQSFSIKGTPAIFTADGTQLGGYLSPAQMKTTLGL